MTEAATAPALGTAGPGLSERSDSFISLSIASAVCTAAFAMSVWAPFMPLYMRRLGAGSKSDALFWAALASAGLGVARIISGPVWGAMADRYGRKSMFVRSLFCASITMVVAGVAQEPWHLVAAFTLQGLTSGFVPAGVALASVSVAPRRVGNALGAVNAGQFVGNTLGPAIGAVLALVLGFRGAILVAAALPVLAGTVVVARVPRDEVMAPTGVPATHRRRPRLVAGASVHFYLIIFIIFGVYTLNQFGRLLTPFQIEEYVGEGNSSFPSGVAFAAAGAAGVGGALVLARLFSRRGRFRLGLVALCAVSGLATALMPFSLGVIDYIAWFAVAALTFGAMVPIMNTIVAARVDPSQRGAAFGLASSAQALGFVIGPLATSKVADVSLTLGFVVAGVLFAVLAWFILAAFREPRSAEGAPL